MMKIARSSEIPWTQAVDRGRFSGRRKALGGVRLTAGMGLTASFPLWIGLRFLAGVASAFVLVGVSSWVLPILAA